MVKGLEGMMDKEQLRSQHLFSLQKNEERSHGSLQLPHNGSRGAGAVLCITCSCLYYPALTEIIYFLLLHIHKSIKSS